MTLAHRSSPARRDPTDGVSPPGGAGTQAEIARCITGRPYLSWTQVAQYQMCPRAFAFKYVESAEPDFVPSSLIFGSAMHEAFASVHEQQMVGLPTPSADHLSSRMSNLLSSSLLPVKFSKNETAETLTTLGRRMVEAFLASPESTPLGTPICIEDRISGQIDPQIPPIEGKVDYVRRSGQGLILRDYKTSRSKWSPDKAEENAPQLRLYACLLDRELTGWKVTEMEFVTVTKAASPVVQVHQVRVKPESVAACVEQIGEVWHGIRNGVFPARPGWPCKTCPFASKCPSAIGKSGAAHG